MIKIRIGKKKSPCGESKKIGFGQGIPPKGEWYKKQEIIVEEPRLLRELTEDELENALAAVAEIDPDELAFNHIFKDKKRLVIDFPVADRDTDAGKFINMWSEMPDVDTGENYIVDWEKGLVSGLRTLEDTGNKAQRRTLDRAIFGGEGWKPEDPRQKKVQMKIGKFLAKVHDLASKRQEIIQLYWKKKYEKQFKGERPYEGGQVNISGEATGRILELVGQEKYDRYDQLTDQLRMYTGNRGMTSYGQFPDKAIRDGKYWQQNAAFIKQNINKMTNDKYVIVITRDPVDMFRMSDFDQISSCHSPPSRPSPSGNSYYKCAVAEAMGHGAVAYVVNKTNLLAAADAETLEEAEANIQEGELFADETRGSHVGYEMDLQPLSRIRVRQFRYYPSDARATDASDYAKPSIEGGVQLAVPETSKMPYGLKIPGFLDRIEDWARESQVETMAGVPRNSNDKIDAGAFVIYGGSYEESSSEGPVGRRRLLASLFQSRFDEFVGEPKQDTSTERKLPKEIGQGIIQWTETAVAEIAMRWNEAWHLRNPDLASHPPMDVSAHVHDHGVDEAGIVEFSIEGSAVMRIFWDADEWNQLPPLNDTAGDWIGDEFKNWELNFVKNVVVIKRGKYIYAKFDINNNSVSNLINWEDRKPVEIDLTHTHLTYSPDGFEEYCKDLEKIDRQREMLKAIFNRIFKRERWLSGGEFSELAIYIEDKEINPDQWVVDTDGEYEDSYEATATLSYDFDHEALGIEPEALLKILNSRPFRLLVRKKLLKIPREIAETQYWLSIADSNAEYYGGIVRYQIQFRVTADDPDEQALLFRTLVTEMDDENEIAEIMNQVIKDIQNARNPDFDERTGLNENKKYDADWAVKTWKLGL